MADESSSPEAMDANESLYSPSDIKSPVDAFFNILPITASAMVIAFFVPGTQIPIGAAWIAPVLSAVLGVVLWRTIL